MSRGELTKRIGMFCNAGPKAAPSWREAGASNRPRLAPRRIPKAFRALLPLIRE